jgi:hypothetical protein
MISIIGKCGMDLIIADYITAVLVEQHEYLPMRRGQRARFTSDYQPMSAPIDIARLIENVCERDFLAAAIAQRHGSSVNSQGARQ